MSVWRALGWLLLLTGVAPLVGAESMGKVGYAHIEGPIDRLRNRYLERVIEEAREQKLDTLVVHIDTDGGEVFHARDMFKAVLEQARGGPRMIAYVDYRAISAGAMVAYAHDAIYVAPTASIGDVGVIFRKPDGEITYAPEKIETVVRTLLTQASEQRGWNRGLLLKMTARNQKLYRVKGPEGKAHYVIEDDLAEFLSEYPNIDKEDPSQVIVYRGEDRLLTLTGLEAVKLGMATAVARDLDELYRKLAIERASVVDLSPTVSEEWTWFLARFGPILVGLALLFIMFELKTPGVGLWAGLGVLFGALFLLTHFALDLLNNIELILIVAGVCLLFGELFTVFGGGVLGVAGGLLTFTGLVLGFLPDDLDYDLSDHFFQDALSDAALNATYSIGILAAGILSYVWSTSRPKTSLLARYGFVLQEEITATSSVDTRDEPELLVGRTGEAGEALTPRGTVTLGMKTYTARAEYGAYIESGRSVKVVAVEFGELLVRTIDSSEA